MGIRCVDRRHLSALHLGNAAVRIEDEDVDCLTVATGLYCGRAGIPRSGADNRQMLAVTRQHRVEQRPDELQCQVLEGERRPVKQFK